MAATRFFIILILGLLSFGSSPVLAAEPGPSTAKPYAVFVASFSSTGKNAIGGVAGTAFFISPTKAMTAFHVLKPDSFLLTPGYDHRRIWLVHENEPAIEVQASFLETSAQFDATIIRFPKAPAVPRQFIYAMASSPVDGDAVETDGYRAETGGPIFERRGDDLAIISVPHLERLHTSGRVMREAHVNLRAVDVNLEEAHCVQLSYTPVVGLSGGPVLVNGRVIGMNSFADPSRRDSTWALRLEN